MHSLRKQSVVSSHVPEVCIMVRVRYSFFYRHIRSYNTMWIGSELRTFPVQANFVTKIWVMCLLLWTLTVTNLDISAACFTADFTAVLANCPHTWTPRENKTSRAFVCRTSSFVSHMSTSAESCSERTSNSEDTDTLQSIGADLPAPKSKNPCHQYNIQYTNMNHCLLCPDHHVVAPFFLSIEWDDMFGFWFH